MTGRTAEVAAAEPILDRQSEIRTIRIDATRGHAGDPITVPYGTLIHDARYGQDGADLILTGRIGLRVVLTGYFARTDHPALTSQHGAYLAGSLVATLAGVSQHEAHSRTRPIAAGRLGRVRGRCALLRADGTLEAGEVGSPLFVGDLVRSESESTVDIELTDGTRLSIGPETRLVLRGESADGADERGLTLVKGTLHCNTSAAAGGEARTLHTTLAKVTPRGRVHFSVATDGKEDRVARLSDEQGGRGRVLVGNNAGVVVLSRADQATIVTDAALEPTNPFKLSPAEVETLRDPTPERRQTPRPVTAEVVMFPSRALR